MRIAYLSNAKPKNLLTEKDNPAGQNFHFALASSLSRYADVTMLTQSLPFGEVRRVNESLSFLGIRQNGNFLVRAWHTRSLLREYDGVVFDTLSLFCCYAASCLSNSVAVATDDPANLSDLSKQYRSLSIRLSRKAGGFYALTNELMRLYNPKGKKGVVVPGIAYEVTTRDIERRPYLYFGGALFERYGVDSLLSTYLEFRPDYDLLISGHGKMEAELERYRNAESGIVYLGNIPQSEHCSYVKCSALSINPRPFDERLDPYCVPSKVIEYLEFAPYFASTRSTPLDEEIYRCGNLLVPEDGDPTGLRRFYKDHLDSSGKLINLNKNPAKGGLIDKISPENVGKAILSLLR